jgi:hypothetical protein
MFYAQIVAASAHRAEWIRYAADKPFVFNAESVGAKLHNTGS